MECSFLYPQIICCGFLLQENSLAYKITWHWETWLFLFKMLNYFIISDNEILGEI